MTFLPKSTAHQCATEHSILHVIDKGWWRRRSCRQSAHNLKRRCFRTVKQINIGCHYLPASHAVKRAAKASNKMSRRRFRLPSAEATRATLRTLHEILTNNGSLTPAGRVWLVQLQDIVRFQSLGFHFQSERVSQCMRSQHQLLVRAGREHGLEEIRTSTFFSASCAPRSDLVELCIHRRSLRVHITIHSQAQPLTPVREIYCDGDRSSSRACEQSARQPLHQLWISRPPFTEQIASQMFRSPASAVAHRP